MIHLTGVLLIIKLLALTSLIQYIAGATGSVDKDFGYVGGGYDGSH